MCCRRSGGATGCMYLEACLSYPLPDTHISIVSLGTPVTTSGRTLGSYCLNYSCDPVSAILEVTEGTCSVCLHFNFRGWKKCGHAWRRMGCKGRRDREGSEKMFKDCGEPRGDPMCANVFVCTRMRLCKSSTQQGYSQNPLLSLTFQILFTLRKDNALSCPQETLKTCFYPRHLGCATHRS